MQCALLLEACALVTERLGPYELLRHIATGGMAEIFLAKNRAQGEASPVVVVKRMLPQLTTRPDFVQMFVDEGRLTQQLRHRHIVHALDIGEADGTHYIVMELVDGPHLGGLFAHSLRNRNALPVPLCAWVVARAAEGLHHAHESKDNQTGLSLQLVHRDISPQNLLVGRNGDVKVTDFGVAKADNQQTKTRTGIIKGKVAYMSPEQCLGDRVDRRTDVFALGIVLYELLTRRRLFRDKSDLLVMQRITGSDVPPPSSVNPEVDAGLDRVVLAALARRLDDRTPTALQLAQQLDAWLHATGHTTSSQTMAAWFAEHASTLAPSTTLPTQERAAWSVPASHEAEATRGTPSLPATLAIRGDTVVAGLPTEMTSADMVSDVQLRAEQSSLSSPTVRMQSSDMSSVLGRLRATRPQLVDVAAMPSTLGVPVTPVATPSSLRPTDVDLEVDALAVDEPAATNKSMAAVLGMLGAVIVAGGVAFAVWPTSTSVDVEAPASGPPPASTKIPTPTTLTSPTTTDEAASLTPALAPVTEVAPKPAGEPPRDKRAAQKQNPPKTTPVAPPAPAAEVSVGTGTVRIRTTPWTNVSVGKDMLGATPFMKPTGAGKRTLTFVNPTDGIRESLAVTIPTDGTLTVDIKFEKVGDRWIIGSKTIK
jgi:eukaryotic-like serine/threonine-protein kinase